MKKIAVIPARYAATRFPYKLMQVLGDKTVIRHTYENTLATKLFDEVFVVTDHELIYNEIVNHGGRAIMSKKAHESGTDRIAEAVESIEAEVILNVQGDEPFIDKESLSKLLGAFENPKVEVASVMKKLTDPVAIENPNIVKVIVDCDFNSIYFSRSPIPFHRDRTIPILCYEHIGVYAFRRKALMQFTTWEITPLEAIEKIECLRFLENGIRLKMIETDFAGVKIDVPEDLEKARDYLKKIAG